MTDDRRAVLEAIAYGDDPELRPADRLRALELLREYRDDEDLDTIFRREIAEMNEDTLLAHLDSLLAFEFATEGFQTEKFPELASSTQSTEKSRRTTY
jgi:hypothetical protein